MADRNKGPTKPLTNKQEAFVIAVVEGKSKSDAYRENYNTGNMTEKTIHEAASKLMADPKVNARYEELLNKVRKSAEEKAIITVEDVLMSIIEIRTVCMQQFPVVSKVTGDVIANNILDIPGALKANELLGKTLKMFTDKIEHTGQLNVDVKTTLIDKYLDD